MGKYGVGSHYQSQLNTHPASFVRQLLPSLIEVQFEPHFWGGLWSWAGPIWCFQGPLQLSPITNWLALGRQHFRRWMPVALFQRCVVSGKRWGSCREDFGVNHLDLSVFGFGVGHGWLWIFGSLNPLVNRHFPHEMPMTWGNGNFFSTLP